MSPSIAAICRANAADRTAALGAMGSPTKPWLGILKMFGRAFERALIVSVDPRSVIELELVHRLASLMWRLRRASAIETGLFEIQGECPLALRHDPSRGAAQSGTIQPPTGANGHSKVSASSGPHDPPVNEREPLPTSKERSLGRGSRSRSIAQCFLHLPILTRPCLTAWAVTKRDCGAKQRKQYGLLTL
jgi:hypothetical protein